MLNFNNYVSLDLETTGLEPRTCDIIELAMIKVRDGEIVDRMETFVFTPLEISEHISYLTGITARDLEKAPDFISLISQVEEFIGDDPLVGHNIWFDWNFLMQKGVRIKDNQLWDTYIMSNILYPELPSHSLETNTKYFGISHEDSHRAMADVMACHELWQILMQSSPDLDSNQAKQMQKLCSKSDWPLLPFFVQDSPTQKKYLQITDPNYYHPTSEPDLKIPRSDHHLFVHAPGKEPVDVAMSVQTTGKTLIIAGYEHTLRKIQLAFPKAFWLKSPYDYISSFKQRALWERDKLESAETTLLLKTILRPSAFSKEELVLSHPEREIWKQLNCSNDADPDNNFQFAYRQSLQAETVICSQFHVFNDLEYIQNFDQLIILEPQLLEDNATKSFGKSLYLEQWRHYSATAEWVKTGEHLFSQLDKLGNTLVPGSQYAEHILLTDMISSSNEFIRLKTMISDMVRDSKDAKILSYLKYYQAFFFASDSSWIRWITVDPRRGVSINVAPMSVQSLLDKHLFQKCSSVIISDTSADFDFLPNMEQISIKSSSNYQIHLPSLSLISGTKAEGDHPALIGYLAAQIPKLSGKTGVIFSSKSILKRYFFDIVKVIPDHITMLGEDISGGSGKLQDRYLSSTQTNKILFLTYRNLRSFAPEVLDFDQMLLQSLPFDPPGLPVHQKRADQCANPFLEYVLPRTQQNLLEILSNLSKRPGSRNVFVLDRRAQEKDYGQELLNLLADKSRNL